MPDHEEHCLHSEKRYGIRGADIHQWIDEPSQIAGGSHRNYRHDLESITIAIEAFGKIYGAEMVENIFLDHLKTDSEKNRKNKKQKQTTAQGAKVWTKEEDDYLFLNFMEKNDNELEANLKTKTVYSIRKRRTYLGLIKPQIIKRTSKREQRLVFKLKRGQKFFLKMKINGGNNDIEFCIKTRRKTYHPEERIQGEKEIEFVPKITGRYSFIFSNSFSVFTSKNISASYQLVNGREVKFKIGL